jgi:arylamine N-acetyltransferase
VAQPTPHGPFRLVDQPDGLALQARVGGDWVGLYVLAADPQLPADIEAANWLVANRPGGIFTANLVASRAPPGRRLSLLNRRLTSRDKDGAETVTLLPGPALGDALRRAFGLMLDDVVLAAIEAALAAMPPGHIPA